MLIAVIIYLDVATARLVKACIILTLILKHNQSHPKEAKLQKF